MLPLLIFSSDGVGVISKGLNSTTKDWQANVELAWNLIQVYPLYGTHFHIIVVQEAVTKELKCLAKSVYYEPAVTTVMPSERKVPKQCFLKVIG